MQKYNQFIKKYNNLNNNQKEEIRKVFEYIDRTKEEIIKYQNSQELIIKMIEAKVPNLYLVRLLKAKSLGRGVTKLKMMILYSRAGYIKWEAYVEKQRISNTFEYKKSKFGMTKTDFDSYNKSRAVTAENLQLRHGELVGKEKFKAYQERQRYAGCALEYFKEKYGNDEEGIMEYERICKLKTHNVENTMNRYNLNEEQAVKLLSKRRDKAYKTGKGFSVVSKISQELCWAIYHRLPEELKEKCYFGELNQEFSKYSKETKGIFFYDFCISSINYILEYNGDFFHANPNKYNVKDHIRLGGKDIPVTVIWEKDKQKKNLAQNLNFSYTIIWDSDYRNNKEKTIERIVNEIITTHRVQNS